MITTNEFVARSSHRKTPYTHAVSVMDSDKFYLRVWCYEPSIGFIMHMAFSIVGSAMCVRWVTMTVNYYVLLLRMK